LGCRGVWFQGVGVKCVVVDGHRTTRAGAQGFAESACEAPVRVRGQALDDCAVRGRGVEVRGGVRDVFDVPLVHGHVGLFAAEYAPGAHGKRRATGDAVDVPGRCVEERSPFRREEPGARVSRRLPQRYSTPANATLADLYGLNSMPADLVKAHCELDRAVDALYGRGRFDEVNRIARLLERYQSLVGLCP
jgi:hypothetical protein